MSKLHPAVERVTARIIDKSKDSRRRYLDLMEREHGVVGRLLGGGPGRRLGFPGG